ncbi:class I SAM-dependent methyltransferase [Roseococcus sp. SYP-B2431]|uniref:class I SAM-dependent methyltransferase n=1 Tax=Roseococcus sp. SYP-B2431 TaxID=2496640 RepID=UPI001039CF43|nr:class I SAM-dependent methyltransferase [Roseococcus sp. SYP-B2431]TCH97813.1 class I SAM-dependent methyltransferase [Roseococcus sp. SYP-B2431]
MTQLTCSVCGGDAFKDVPVIWPALIAEWGLSKEEAAYIDRQQGRICTACGANLRIVALGRAVLAACGHKGTLREMVADPATQTLRVLDLNGVEGISQAMQALPFYRRADYPEVDAQALPYPGGSFDLVIHSDTLEHIPRPIVALEQCRRVLAAGGRLCFTVPTVVQRLSRSREGLPPSYHGAPGDDLHDFRVETEFGADVWTYVLRAGFEQVTINHVEFPTATAMTAW